MNKTTHLVRSWSEDLERIEAVACGYVVTPQTAAADLPGLVTCEACRSSSLLADLTAKLMAHGITFHGEPKIPEFSLRDLLADLEADLQDLRRATKHGSSTRDITESAVWKVERIIEWLAPMMEGEK